MGRPALSALPRWSWRISHQVAKVRGSHGLLPRSFSNEAFIRACLAIDVDTSIGGRRVAEVLQRLIDTRGKPAMLITDNGPEFISRALDAWAYAHGVDLHFIEPGKPRTPTSRASTAACTTSV